MPARVGNERISPGDHITAGFRGVAEEVVSEDGAPSAPILGIQVSAVSGLQLLDRLDLTEALDTAEVRRGRVTGTTVSNSSSPEKSPGLVVYRASSPAMAIEAVLFDIGGVLEETPRTGWEQRWADQLGMSIEEFERRFGDTAELVGGVEYDPMHFNTRRITTLMVRTGAP